MAMSARDFRTNHARSAHPSAGCPRTSSLRALSPRPSGWAAAARHWAATPSALRCPAAAGGHAHEHHAPRRRRMLCPRRAPQRASAAAGAAAAAAAWVQRHCSPANGRRIIPTRMRCLYISNNHIRVSRKSGAEGRFLIQMLHGQARRDFGLSAGVTWRDGGAAGSGSGDDSAPVPRTTMSPVVIVNTVGSRPELAWPLPGGGCRGSRAAEVVWHRGGARDAARRLPGQLPRRAGAHRLKHDFQVGAQLLLCMVACTSSHGQPLPRCSCNAAMTSSGLCMPAGAPAPVPRPR